MLGGVNGPIPSSTWDPGHAPLGTLIFRAGLLTEEQIQDSLREGERTGKRLGEVLVERGLLSEKEVTRMLAKQRGAEFVDLQARSVDRDAAHLLPVETARRYRALPFAFENETPLVAVTDVDDETTRRALQEAVGREARFVLAGSEDVAAAIAKAYAPATDSAPASVPSLVPPGGEDDPTEGRPETSVAPPPPPVPTPSPEPAVEPPSAPPASVPPISHELHVVPASPPAAEELPSDPVFPSVEAPPPAAPPVAAPAAAPEPVQAPPLAEPVETAPPGEPVEASPPLAAPAEAPPAEAAVEAAVEATPLTETPVVKPVEPAPAPVVDAVPAGAAEPPEADTLHWGGSLGELLLESGLLTSEQIEDALREAARRGRRLGEIVLERGWVHERTLAHCLASQKGLPFVSLRDRPPTAEAAKLLPRKTAQLYAALPIELEGEIALVAISDPTNEAAMASVRAALGAEVRFAVAATSELASALERAYDALEPAPVAAPPPVEPTVQAAPAAAEHPRDLSPGAERFVVVIRLLNSDAVEVGTYASAAEAEAEAGAVVKRLASSGPSEWPSFRGRFLRPDAIVSVDIVTES